MIQKVKKDNIITSVINFYGLEASSFGLLFFIILAGIFFSGNHLFVIILTGKSRFRITPSINVDKIKMHTTMDVPSLLFGITIVFKFFECIIVFHCNIF